MTQGKQILDSLKKIQLSKLFPYIVIIVLAALFLDQCGKTRDERVKRETTERIAEQNLRAMNDSAVVLKMTRKQLAYADSALSATVTTIEKLIKELGSKKDVVREVIRIKPVIVQKDVEVFTYVKVDPNDSTKHDLEFSVNDSIKSFNGVSSFYLDRTDSTINVRAGKTNIKNFNLNFDFVLVKYDDAVNKVSKYKIVPYYTDLAGRSTMLTEDQIKFQFRGVELLDKPWQENSPGPVTTKKKLRLVGKWGVGLNPVGIVPIIQGGVVKIVQAPSISAGYFLTFEKR